MDEATPKTPKKALIDRVARMPDQQREEFSSQPGGHDSPGREHPAEKLHPPLESSDHDSSDSSLDSNHGSSPSVESTQESLDVPAPRSQLDPLLLHPGHQFGKYLIEQKLGEGGQAQVFQAFDRFGALGHVALKLPRSPLPQEYVEAWARREVQPTVRLSHPSIVRVVDAGCVDGVPYIATPLIQGMQLGDWVKSHSIGETTILDWMVQLCDAIASAHDDGVIHRDLKPGNILVSSDVKPVIIDFGIAIMWGPHSHLRTNTGSGTPSYMAPEQARQDGEADHRVDIFGLGAILKFLLDRSPPYEGKSVVEVADAVRGGRVAVCDVNVGPALRRALAGIANRALCCDPQGRYQTAGEMRSALRAVRVRRRGLIAIAATAAIVLCSFGLNTAFQSNENQSTPALDVSAAQFEIHFQRQSQQGSYQMLTADLLPLYSGDRLQIHVKLPRPLHVAVIVVSGDGSPHVIYPEDDNPQQSPVQVVHIPPEPDHWLPLTPPVGTETLVLIASPQPLPPRHVLEAKLSELGRPPVLSEVGLLVADRQGSRFQLPGGLTRAMGSVVVQSDKGLVDRLITQSPSEWPIVRVLAFPHKTRE